MPHRKRLSPVTDVPTAVPTSPKPPSTKWVAAHKPPTESTAVAMKPRYSAPMIELLEPRRTKKVPMIEVMMQAPQIASG